MKIEAIEFGCGCKAIPMGDKSECVDLVMVSWHIKHCTPHAAVGDLLAACKETLNDGTTMRRTRLICEAAIAKAGPLTTPGSSSAAEPNVKTEARR